jgi:hypothetical protein
VLTFYLPVAVITIAVLTGVMLMKRMPRWAGSVLLLCYALYVSGAWFLEVGQHPRHASRQHEPDGIDPETKDHATAKHC